MVRAGSSLPLVVTSQTPPPVKDSWCILQRGRSWQEAWLTSCEKKVISFASPTDWWAKAAAKFRGRCRICVLLFFSFLSLITSQVLEVWAFYLTVGELDLFCLPCDLLELSSLELSHLCNGFEGSCFVCLKGLFWINSWLRKDIVNRPKALCLWGLVWRDLQYEMRDLGLSSGSAPSMVTGSSERVPGDPETTPLPPASHPVYSHLARIFHAYGLNTLGIILVILSFIFISLIMSLTLICVQRKKEKFVCMEGFCKERRMFSHWQILSSCVSNETEASGSLVYFLVSILT